MGLSSIESTRRAVSTPVTLAIWARQATGCPTNTATSGPTASPSKQKPSGLHCRPDSPPAPRPGNEDRVPSGPFGTPRSTPVADRPALQPAPCLPSPERSCFVISSGSPTAGADSLGFCQGNHRIAKGLGGRLGSHQPALAMPLLVRLLALIDMVLPPARHLPIGPRPDWPRRSDPAWAGPRPPIRWSRSCSAPTRASRQVRLPTPRSPTIVPLASLFQAKRSSPGGSRNYIVILSTIAVFLFGSPARFRPIAPSYAWLPLSPTGC